ncbi:MULTISPECIES: undecaprenyl-phosphate glucose phosphotransferase [Rhodopseudomonas]|uniref:UDP-phosphate glucose phosphotransferase n=1 Tax=Rhodopseudomonas palustris TaxID=1076 RepID=A0A0D7EAX4_RHOPL|nr:MULTISPECIES: undecaprenyl-phosphate glucose phosphotransferase [Rhodopseudomonas]KIZ37863.1 UDP-phosphate glucose phosphotransferase [Rhodopseudomonas palustris]MDF3808803.1 undecaprenyl-phosphate glucose phosphotransferase [Rhodopseudomonas sp. BAL398]WOK19162.1 undecaprenyl-phosphate glucose phosphotransferase [Rhodopseudomonas sp. BAL398]
MEPINARAIITDASTTKANPPIVERRRRLSPAALAVTNQKVRSAYSPIVIGGLVRLADAVLIALIGVSVYLAYVARNEGFNWNYIAAIFGMTATALVCFEAADIYQVQVFRGTLRQMTRMISAWSFVFLLFIGASFLAKLGGEISRIWLSSFFIVGLAALICERMVLRGMVRRWGREGRLDRRTIIVGSDENGEKLIEALKEDDDSDLRILGVFDDRNDARALETCGGVPKLGKIDDIVEFARRTRVDLVLFALPISAETRILQMLKKLWVLPVDIRLSAHTNKLRFRPRAYSYLGTVPTLDVFEAPITDWDQVMKRLFDHIVGALILLAVSPVMALVALAIKLDSPGPVLFRQKRFGFNNERIDVFKFRSLYHDQADPLAAKVVTKNDKRVTRVGRIIRRTSLDELPQLFNVVFKSNLSLVGPRPHAVQGKLQSQLFDEAVDGYFARHRVKPGITGWAQINGWRGEIDNEEKIQKRVEFDLYYIENWSVLFDLFILLKTPLALLKGENAY